MAHHHDAHHSSDESIKKSERIKDWPWDIANIPSSKYLSPGLSSLAAITPEAATTYSSVARKQHGKFFFFFCSSFRTLCRLINMTVIHYLFIFPRWSEGWVASKDPSAVGDRQARPWLSAHRSRCVWTELHWFIRWDVRKLGIMLCPCRWGRGGARRERETERKRARNQLSEELANT